MAGASLLLVAGCDNATSRTPEPTTVPVQPTLQPIISSAGTLILEPVAEGVDQPTALADAGGGRMYVTEQSGRVRVIEDGELLPAPLLDLRSRILNEGERGLLGIALHPEYSTNGRIFVVYSNLDGHTELREFRPAADDPALSTTAPSPSGGPHDQMEERLLLLIPQYTHWHQGGGLAFGPDGFLYLSVGDDGRQDNQPTDPHDIKGSILRLDVDAEADAQDVRTGFAPGALYPRYAIPPDNPYAEGGGAPEIWDYGLRNPWRFSFDRLTGDLWIGDVGQNEAEEVNLHRAGTAGGLNFGWIATEGRECRLEGCETDGITWPAVAYPHDDANCGVIGGYVVRTEHVLNGQYLFGDLCSGRIWSVDAEDPGEPTLQMETGYRMSSFGTDLDGRIYVLVHFHSGRVFRITD